MIKLLIGIPLWVAAFFVRLIFMVIGVFFIPLMLLSDGFHRTSRMWTPIWGDAADVPDSHNKNRWTKYVWMAWRNPVEGLDHLLKQPMLEKRPNPDDMVRSASVESHSRWMQHGVFWEYWSLRAMKNGKYWEFRIGWKFVDGNDDFVPTIQLGPKK